MRVRECDRDALPFHWLRNIDSNEVETLRFTRALFGLGPSPFLLGSVIEQHLVGWSATLPERVAEISRSLYVDDLISGGATITEARDLKREATEIFADAAFELHKWHSNEPELESEDPRPEIESDGDMSFAKQKLGSTAVEECKLLGLAWDKAKDTLSVAFAVEKANPTKSGILAKLASVYDPLGLVSPVTLQGKLIYREACELKLAWDATLPGQPTKQWDKLESAWPTDVITARV